MNEQITNISFVGAGLRARPSSVSTTSQLSRMLGRNILVPGNPSPSKSPAASSLTGQIIIGMIESAKQHVEQNKAIQTVQKQEETKAGMQGLTRIVSNFVKFYEED